MQREYSYKSSFPQEFDNKVENTALGELRCKGNSVDQTIEWSYLSPLECLKQMELPFLYCRGWRHCLWNIKWLGKIFKSLIFK